jgi:metal-responsive CopG/Arc/MetJ family transcriptional regulator
MKTAISVPDETFERVDRRASELSVSRSEFFARAARHYLDDLDAESLTGQIDSVVEQLGIPEETRDAVTAGHQLLDALDDEW